MTIANKENDGQQCRDAQSNQRSALYKAFDRMIEKSNEQTSASTAKSEVSIKQCFDTAGE
jgi:hypothetical protein